MCGFCFDIKTCFICNKVFITQHTEKSEKYFCSHECSRRFASKKMNEWYEIGERRSNVAKLNHKINDKIKYCNNCNQETKHIIGIGCVNCYNKTNQNRIQASSQFMTNLWKNNNFKEKYINNSYCEECNKDIIDQKELCWIDKLKPYSQKCDGTDRIKKLNERFLN